MTTTNQLALSESMFQEAVIEYARRNGWLVHHESDSRREVVNKRTGARSLVGDDLAAGFPDLVLVRDDRLVFAELKRETGKLTDKQERWLAAFSDVESACDGHVEVHAWRPSDWRSIERVLGRRFT